MQVLLNTIRLLFLNATRLLGVAMLTSLLFSFSLEEGWARALSQQQDQQQGVRNVTAWSANAATSVSASEASVFAGGQGQRVRFHFDFVGAGELLVMQYSDNEAQGQAFDAWAKRVGTMGARIDSLVIEAYYTPSSFEGGLTIAAEVAKARIIAVRDHLLRALEHNGLGGVVVLGKVRSVEQLQPTQDQLDGEEAFEMLRTLPFTLYLNGAGAALGGGVMEVRTTTTAASGTGASGGSGVSGGGAGQMLSSGLRQEQLLAMMTNPYPVWVPGMMQAYTRVQQQRPQPQRGRYTAPVEPVQRPVQLQQPTQVYIQQPGQVYVQQPVLPFQQRSQLQQPQQHRQTYAQPVRSQQQQRPQQVQPQPRQARQRQSRPSYRYPQDQVFGIKTNLPYWLALAPNAGVEFYMGPVSLAIEGTLSYWERGNTTGDKGIYVAEGGAEFRYWFQRDRRYGGHVIGVYGQFGEFDVKLNETGRQGTGFGGGISYTYYLPISNIFAFEFGLGLGALGLKYDVYQWDENVQKNLLVKDKRETYLGPTKVKAALILRIGNKMR